MLKENIVVQVPSNIAFIKYWGKYGRQLPMNESISMTLKNCYTQMEVEYWFSKESRGVQDFLFEGASQEKFKAKINKYLTSIEDLYPLGKNLNLNIKSSNTFPHSAGIASSASAMGALALILVKIEAQKEQTTIDFKRVSELARLASGSACRSLFPHYAVWGESDSFEQGSNNFARPFTKFHSNFSEVGDSVLIISDQEKSVSSTAGHQLMNDHPFRAARVVQAKENFKKCLLAMEAGDWQSFGEVLENEALTLHGLMLNSSPSFILLEAKSLEAIKLIRNQREKDKDLQLYFTIDAGPNIHLIYPLAQKEKVRDFIDSTLKPTFLKVIHDEIGLGALEQNV